MERLETTPTPIAVNAENALTRILLALVEEEAILEMEDGDIQSPQR